MKDNPTLEERRKRAYKYLKDDVEMIMCDALIKLAVRQITIKFGTVSQEIKDKLSRADYKNLELVIEKIITLDSIDDIISHLEYKI